MDLDRFIAENVMGWTDVGFLPGGNVLYGCPPDDYNRDFPTNKHKTHVPKYSRNISSAFEVVERMWELGFRVRLETDDDLHPTGKPWYCLFEKPPEGGFGEAYSDMAQKAICLAAKAALEG